MVPACRRGCTVSFDHPAANGDTEQDGGRRIREFSVPSGNLDYLKFLHMCMFFSGLEPKFENPCKSAGIFDETGSFLQNR
ncbi:hypothetical protein J25TS5_16320 [Paenibacillus faecis]|nr:hypothetical protein J25TS5_16320 [Paenibacillus faecis]